MRDAHHVFSPINHTLKQVFPKVYGYTILRAVLHVRVGV